MIKRIVILLASIISFHVQAFPALPFCPLGGPPGWMHRVLDRHDHERPPVFYQARPVFYSPPQTFPQSRGDSVPSFRYGQQQKLPVNQRQYDESKQILKPPHHPFHYK